MCTSSTRLPVSLYFTPSEARPPTGLCSEFPATWRGLTLTLGCLLVSSVSAAAWWMGVHAAPRASSQPHWYSLKRNKHCNCCSVYSLWEIHYVIYYLLYCTYVLFTHKVDIHWNVLTGLSFHTQPDVLLIIVLFLRYSRKSVILVVN